MGNMQIPFLLRAATPLAAGTRSTRQRLSGSTLRRGPHAVRIKDIVACRCVRSWSGALPGGERLRASDSDHLPARRRIRPAEFEDEYLAAAEAAEEDPDDYEPIIGGDPELFKAYRELFERRCVFVHL